MNYEKTNHHDHYTSLGYELTNPCHPWSDRILKLILSIQPWLRLAEYRKLLLICLLLHEWIEFWCKSYESVIFFANIFGKQHHRLVLAARNTINNWELLKQSCRMIVIFIIVYLHRSKIWNICIKALKLSISCPVRHQLRCTLRLFHSTVNKSSWFLYQISAVLFDFWNITVTKRINSVYAHICIIFDWKSINIKKNFEEIYMFSVDILFVHSFRCHWKRLNAT